MVLFISVILGGFFGNKIIEYFDFIIIKEV